jgi:hypothetical protein
MTGAPPRPAWQVWLRRLAPWVMTAAAVFFILREYPVDQIVAEMQRGDALPMVPIGIGLTFSVLAMVALWDWVVLFGMLGGPRYWDVIRAKGGMGVLLTLGYGFGHGGYGVWIARATRATVAEAIGVTLYISASDLCALCLVATGMIHLGGADVPRSLAIAAPSLAGVLVLFTLVGPFQKTQRPRVFAPWRLLSRKRQLANIAGRTVNISFIVVMTWLATRAFGLEIPFDVMSSYLPLIMLVGSLPINIAGFGPVQGMWLLFEPWASGPSLLAFQFLWHLVIASGLVLRGLPFIRRVVTEIAEGKAAADRADAQDDAQIVGQDS